MATSLRAVSVDALDPDRLAGFWSAVLGREHVEGPVGPELLPDAEPGFLLRFAATDEPRTGPGWLHPDLTSTSLEDQQATVDLVLDLGGSRLDWQAPGEDHVVLADPEGNELCVVGPDNRFLAGTGRLGCLSCSGSRAVGLFWSQALDWPLVWDEGEETAIQSPAGGSKISWGGADDEPPGRTRWRLDLSPSPDSDQQREVERLVGLGARELGLGAGPLPVVRLADPDGHELGVLPS